MCVIGQGLFFFFFFFFFFFSLQFWPHRNHCLSVILLVSLCCHYRSNVLGSLDPWITRTWLMWWKEKQSLRGKTEEERALGGSTQACKACSGSQDTSLASLFYLDSSMNVNMVSIGTCSFDSVQSNYSLVMADRVPNPPISMDHFHWRPFIVSCDTTVCLACLGHRYGISQQVQHTYQAAATGSRCTTGGGKLLWESSVGSYTAFAQAGGALGYITPSCTHLMRILFLTYTE